MPWRQQRGGGSAAARPGPDAGARLPPFRRSQRARNGLPRYVRLKRASESMQARPSGGGLLYCSRTARRRPAIT